MPIPPVTHWHGGCNHFKTLALQQIFLSVDTGARDEEIVWSGKDGFTVYRPGASKGT
jgi:hypothetical protein